MAPRLPLHPSPFSLLPSPLLLLPSPLLLLYPSLLLLYPSLLLLNPSLLLLYPSLVLLNPSLVLLYPSLLLPSSSLPLHPNPQSLPPPKAHHTVCPRVFRQPPTFHQTAKMSHHLGDGEARFVGEEPAADPRHGFGFGCLDICCGHCYNPTADSFVPHHVPTHRLILINQL